MFDSLKSMAGMAGLMKDLPRIKARMQQVKKDLEEVSIDAESGGGAVRATVNGQLRLTGLRIDQSMMAGLVGAGKNADRAIAEDLILSAVNAAMGKARARAAEEINSAAREFNLPIPAGGLTDLIS